jgi:hypothetical protein
MQYRSLQHAALGVSPHGVVFGRKPVQAFSLANLFALAGGLVPAVSVVMDNCEAPLLHVQLAGALVR